MLILASQSPRREEILRNTGFSFKIIPSNADENICGNFTPAETAVEIATLKAKSVVEMLNIKDNIKDYIYDKENDAVIGADTIVICDNEIMGKPKNANDAFRMLSALSDKTHTVITGVCIVYKYGIKTFYESTEVEFYALSDIEINKYIDTGEPFDKAGAYGIQEKGVVLIKKINGDYFNVMGLPIAKLVRVLKELKIEN